MDTQAMESLRTLSWMSPTLGLALGSAVIVALAYTVVAVRPLWMLPFYWCVSVAGLAAGQIASSYGAQFFVVGDLALGSGLVACIMLFSAVHLVTLWYTGGHRVRAKARSKSLHQER